METLARMDQKEIAVPQECQDFLVHRVSRVCRDKMALKGLTVSQDAMGLREREDILAVRDYQDYWAHRECRDCQA